MKNVLQFSKGFINLTTDLSESNEKYAMSVNSELMQFGFTLNKKAIKLLSKASVFDINVFKNEVVEYLKDNLDAASLRNILSMLNIPASELIRKGEPAYKENFKGKELTEEEWISAMVEFPKLIERPIIVKGNKAIIARPLERIEELG